MSTVRVNEPSLLNTRRRSALSVHSLFKKSDLGEFCPSELFEIVLANELTSECLDLRNGIIQANKGEEIVSKMVFITPDDLNNFIEAVENDQMQDFWHPPHLIVNLKELCSDYMKFYDANDKIIREPYTRILKHFIINKMCSPRVKAAEFDRRMQILNETLKKLQNNNIISTKPKTNKPKGKKGKKKKKKKETENVLNEVPSKPRNDSDELKDHIYFYILTGFKDTNLLKMLPFHNVPINCILQISSKEYVSRSELNDFWRDIDELSKNSKKYKLTEDIIHMKYVYNSQIPNEEIEDFFRQRLTELYDILLEIPNLKRKHLQYIKHLYPFDFNIRELSYGPFTLYEGNIQKVALEFVTIPYIVRSMVDEAEYMSSDKQRSQELKFNKKVENYWELHKKEDEVEIAKCEKQRCPVKLSYFTAPHKTQLTSKKERGRKIDTRKTLQKFHEGDYLNILISSTKNTKHMVLSDFEILSNQKLLQLRKAYEDSLFYGRTDDVCRLQKRLPTKMKKTIFTKEQTDHFLNLILLSNMEISNDKFQPKPVRSKYLCTGEEIFESLDFLPDSNMLVSCENVYQKFNSMQYQWIEPLPNSVLIQRLFLTQQEFSNCQFQYCPQTNTLLVYFHHNLTPSGTKSRFWRESIRTLTCLRDFCSFYIFEDADWLLQHPPIKQIKYEEYKKNEEARFFQRMIESDNRYKEYKRYLAPFRYCGDSYCQGRLSCLIEECEKTGRYNPIEGLYPNLSEIMSEIKTYPAGSELKKRCAKDRKPDTLLSYDRRRQRFGLTGSTHEFFSHDGVKITIDTCRFHFENFKLSCSVEFDKNVLFSHYRKDDVHVHLVLADETIVKFINIQANFRSSAKPCIDADIKEKVSSFMNTRMESTFNMSWKDEIHKDNSKDDKVEQSMMIQTGERRMKSVYENKNFEELKYSKRKMPDKESKDTYAKVLKTLIPPNESSKVVFHKTDYLVAKLKRQNVPYSSVIKRILGGTLDEDEMPTYHRMVQVKDFDSDNYPRDEFCVKVTVPNGLMIESLPFAVNNDEIIIKQMHSESDKCSGIRDEDYRLFFGNGMILVRFSNGNVKIMDAAGTIVELRETIVKSKTDINHKKCLRSIDTYRKMLYAIHKNSNRKKRKIDLYKRTRRSHLNCSRKLNIQKFHILDKFKIPFSKVDIMSLDGNLYKIRENMVKKNTFSRYLDSHDFLTHEMFKHRTDNMKTLYKSDGSVSFIFPDGTKITKRLLVGKQVEFFTKHDEEGWVVISSSYLYEHPCYLPIEFKNGPKISLIHLKDNVHLTLAWKTCDIDFDGKSSIHINAENIHLQKLCPKCGSGCTCDIDIQWIDFKKNSEKYEPFLNFQDSYNKHFTSDSQGRCKLNTDFIHGELNEAKCNHYLNNDYQKVFLIHGDLSGDLLWNDNMVTREIEVIKQEITKNPLTANLEQFTTTDNSMTSYKFIRNSYTEFRDKYLSPIYMYPMVFMKKVDSDSKKMPTYQVSKSIFNMIQEKDVSELRNIFRKLFKD